MGRTYVDTFTQRLLAPTRRPLRSLGGADGTTFWMGLCAAVLTLPLLALVVSSGRLDAQEENHREVAVIARNNGFNPARLEVRQDDLIKVTFSAEDGPHSFNIDEYRIAKRARPGHPAVFEFRADRAGKFPYYCTLSSGSSTHDIRGELVVVAR
jgi:plastocyanin